MQRNLPFVVEPMSLSDIPQVMAIEMIAFSAPWSTRAFQFEVTENSASTMLVVRPGHRQHGTLLALLRSFGVNPREPLVAYGGFWLLVDEAHINTLAVHTAWQRQGLGELVLVNLLLEGASQGALRSTLEVRVSNLGAQALYRKYGFAVAARQKRYYSDNNEDGFIMVTPEFGLPEFQHRLDTLHQRLMARLMIQVDAARS